MKPQDDKNYSVDPLLYSETSRMFEEENERLQKQIESDLEFLKKFSQKLNPQEE